MNTAAENPDEVARRGQELYRRLRPQIETAANVGKLVALDVDSGDFEVDADLLAAARRLRARRPDGALWSERIGYNAAFAVGGTLTRTDAGPGA